MARRALLVAAALSAVPVAEGEAQLPVEGRPASPIQERFRRFASDFGRAYAEGSEEYGRRLELFQQRVQEVQAHNAKASRRWTAGVNGLSDRTDAELAALRGYRHGARPGGSGGGGGAMAAAGIGLAAISTREVDLSTLPSNFSWQTHLMSMKDIMDQGSCGSCWAVASATVLRAHAELYQTDRKFSVQQLVDCTPNPKECGGQGGCRGATAELAMEYAAKRGLVLDTERSYTASDQDCPAGMRLAEPGGASSFLALRSSGGAAVRRGGEDGAVLVDAGEGAKFGLIGWRKLPENRAEPLLEALYRSGPVVVSVAANRFWSMYSYGVMDSCEPGAVINHAVVLTGFGTEGASKFWQIQNSWGNGWGEEGFIRMLRRDAREENAFCGWDTSPEQGTACKGGPDKVWVCGSCGVLYDSVLPTFRLSEQGWWHQQGHRPVPAATE